MNPTHARKAITDKNKVVHVTIEINQELKKSYQYALIETGLSSREALTAMINYFIKNKKIPN